MNDNKDATENLGALHCSFVLGLVMPELGVYLFLVCLLAVLAFVVIEVNARNVPGTFLLFERASDLLTVGALFVYWSLVLLSLKFENRCMKIRHFFCVMPLKCKILFLRFKKSFLYRTQSIECLAVRAGRFKLHNQFSEVFNHGHGNTQVGSGLQTNDRDNHAAGEELP